MAMAATSLLDFFCDVRRVASGPGAGLRIVPLEGDPEIARGTYEIPVQTALTDYISPGDVVYDIGANIGFFTMLAARLAGPRGRVHAFEPVPRNAAVITRSARLNRFTGITVHQLAAGACSGQATLTLARHIGGAMLSSVGAPPDACGQLSVEVVAIDDVIRSQGLPLPNLIKIDVEGAELEVLLGMARTLRERRPILICELDDANHEGLAEKARVLTATLNGLDYSLTELAPSYPDADWQVAHFVARPEA